jgi:hypothetical protein
MHQERKAVLPPMNADKTSKQTALRLPQNAPSPRKRGEGWGEGLQQIL